MLPPISRVNWRKTYRLINTCYPPCHVWEDIISSSADWDLAYQLEMMTNPRARQELGNIALVPKERMITGTDSWWVVSAFTHINPLGSRFCNSDYGAYYAARQFITALKEKAYGVCTQFMQATDEDIHDVQCRVLVGAIKSELHDIRSGWEECHAVDDYTHSQTLGKRLRDQDSNGIVYNSVRDQDGECFAAFWPDVVSVPTQERHVILHWDGNAITSYCEIRGDEPVRVPLS